VPTQPPNMPDFSNLSNGADDGPPQRRGRAMSKMETPAMPSKPAPLAPPSELSKAVQDLVKILGAKIEISKGQDGKMIAERRT